MENMERYDRQMIIWGESGQEALSSAHLCILHGDQTLLLLECLKCLVLMGIGEVTLIKETQPHRDSDNRFELMSLEQLRLMNPDVSISSRNVETGEDMELLHSSGFWNSFTLVLCLCSEGVLFQKVRTAWAATEISSVRPNLILSHCNTERGYVRLVGHEPHIVIDSHKNATPDLRLKCMWPELQKFHDGFNLEELSTEEISHLPYTVLLSKAYQHLLDHALPMTRRSVKDALFQLQAKLHLGPFNNSLNFVEADRFSFILFKDDNIFPANLERILEVLESEPRSHFNEWVYQSVLGIRRFYDLYGCLPVRRSVPDMETTTFISSAQQRIYRNKSEQDFSRIEHMTSEYKVPLVLLRQILDNLFKLEIIELSTIPVEQDFNTPLAHAMECSSLGSEEYGGEVTTATILGPIIAQETLKLLSHQYPPIENTLIYECCGNKLHTVKL